MSYKTTDGLMRHLRNNGIAIKGSIQKRQLMNVGYFHGYKGYRFFYTPNRRLPFNSFDEVYATVMFDSKLKALFYGKIMFIETAVKYYALECILRIDHSESIQDMYDKAVCGYHNAPPNATIKEKKKYQTAKLNLQNKIQTYLSKAYREGNPRITHFYDNMGYSGVPIWALFEIMMLGDFANLLSCLTIDARDALSKQLGMHNIAIDTNRELIYEYLYTLKDLRNAIAHNSAIFDTRFRRSDPSKAMRLNLQHEIRLPYVNFKSITDYLILICYYLKNLKVSKKEIKAFIKEYEKIIDEYKNAVSPAVVAMVIPPDTNSRITKLKNYI